MGTKYVSQTQSGYNALPPPDDGSTGTTNLITWSGLKTKLADPTLTLAQNINTALTNALDFSSRTTAVNDTATSADHMKTIECTAALTAKVPTSASVGAGFIVSYKNTSASNVTIGLVTATDTLDGVVNGTITLSPNGAATLKSNLAGTGYYIISVSVGSSGALTVTSLTSSGAVTSSSPSAGIGYSTGAGGSVTQLTAKTTAVTINTNSGIISTFNDSLASGATVTFFVNNSNFLASDLVICNLAPSSLGAKYIVWGGGNTVGQFYISIRNNTAGSLSESLGIYFGILKAVTS